MGSRSLKCCSNSSKLTSSDKTGELGLTNTRWCAIILVSVPFNFEHRFLSSCGIALSGYNAN
ncbi:carbohydrate-binding domain-containing protein [Flavobacterium sp. CFS9]|uniref:carbohydrate-binding domain-containing protein n=1 Tax=Flavobacterium sp. CFS9 TaxID=3143118 RepID=UPI0034E8F1D6